MEATLLLATIAQRFKLVRETSEPVTPFPTITLRPRGGVELRLQQRV